MRHKQDVGGTKYLVHAHFVHYSVLVCFECVVRLPLYEVLAVDIAEYPIRQSTVTVFRVLQRIVLFA